jgi:ribosomal protein S12 methylthiotransferase accessory factor
LLSGAEWGESLRTRFADGSGEGATGYFAGSHRIRRPEETWALLKPAAKAIGITRVANVTGLDRIGIPVVMVCRPRNRSLSVYQGKGLTLCAAKVSGAMESLERFSAEYVGAPDFIGTPTEAASRAGVVAHGLWPLPMDGERRVDAPIGWIRGFDLIADEDVLVPCPVVHLDKRLPGGLGSEGFDNTSTGLAAGNTYTEAIVHGLCEAIERDALTLWRLLPDFRRMLSRIALSSIDGPMLRPLLAAIEGAGLACAIFDLWSATGVPAFVCRIAEFRGDLYRPADMVDGAGCHPCREIALARAITEAAQIRATAIAGSRNDFFRRHYRVPEARDVALVRASVDAPEAGRQFGACASFEHGSAAEDLAFLLDRLRPLVRHVVAVDLTRPELGWPVVRVLVPELEDGEEMARYRPRERAQRAYLGRL